MLTYGLLIVASGLALYFFYQLSKYENKEDSNSFNDLITEKRKEILKADSLVSAGNYQAALKDYKNLMSNDTSFLQNELALRIDIAQKLLNMQYRMLNKNTSKDSLEKDTVVTQRSATPNEVRQYDSLYFALDKAKTQIDNLSRQLKLSSKGAYLTFETKKGNTVNYVGQVKNDQANGRGVALYNTGSRYEGEWKNNLKHGKGTFYWPDGEYYEGEYHQDQRHGTGTYYWPNGEKYVGNWANDHRNGNGIFYGEDGEIVAQGVWKNDELVEVSKR